MTIILRLFQAKDPGHQIDSRRLADGELRIGRDAGQDWALDDPGRLMSRAHLVLSIKREQVSVTDVSSNGVFIAGGDQRLPQGRPTPLDLGSTLRFGPYLLTVERAPEGREAEPARPAPRARDAASPFGEPDSGPFRPDPFTRGVAPDPFGGALDMPAEPARAASRAAPPSASDTDSWSRPRARKAGDWDAPSVGREGHEHLIGSGIPWSEPPPAPAAEVGFGFDAPFSQPILRQVDVARSDLAIPSDWAEPAPRAPSVASDAFSAPRRPEALAREPEFSPLPPAAAEPEPEPILSPPPLAPPPAVVAPPPPAPREPTEPVEAPRPPAGDAALLEAFCRGAKLNAATFTSVEAELMMTRLGVVYRAMILGMSDLMGERTSLKNEYRMVRTTIRSEENNPFKWLPPQAVAAELLLQSQEGFMEGPAAVTAAFVDLKKHLLCLLAGLRAALSSTLGALDPAQVEEALKSQSLGMKNRGAVAWSEYGRLYADWRKEADDNPDSPVNRAFRSAYERQLSELDRLGSD